MTFEDGDKLLSVASHLGIRVGLGNGDIFLATICNPHSNTIYAGNGKFKRAVAIFVELNRSLQIVMLPASLRASLLRQSNLQDVEG